jgi:hypothetical protein
MNAHEILAKVSEVIVERGEERDLETGERSMKRCVLAFNALTDNSLSVEDGWRFLLLLKLSRQQEGKLKEDDYLDTVGYASLLAEEALKPHEKTDR